MHQTRQAAYQQRRRNSQCGIQFFLPQDQKMRMDQDAEKLKMTQQAWLEDAVAAKLNNNKSWKIGTVGLMVLCLGITSVFGWNSYEQNKKITPIILSEQQGHYKSFNEQIEANTKINQIGFSSISTNALLAAILLKLNNMEN